MFYRLRGLLNLALWRLPLPRRVLIRLGMLVYKDPPIPSDLVLKVLGALDDAGVPYWLRGGWGVDALVGTQTTEHEDVDLVIDDKACARAVDALGDLGFSPWFAVDVDEPLGSRIVLHDHPVAGRVVDFQPLDISRGHVAFTTGVIENRPVPCVVLESHLAAYSTYRSSNRRKRRRELATLAVVHGLVQGLVNRASTLDRDRADSSRSAHRDRAEDRGRAGERVRGR
jgi:lincosamide nucleotidyltransferase A/C/D/E